ncbi:hypothetical protein [endosymbiont GvMRE of Glomus versiforme]|uniref:hypothetical protein n=1 Tax=endosymbiont GvMRE of Glomus versiforme TaxID=2039283 RepID=UPI000EDDAC84|nr:hypothetical protein [endosymbiont GvMRE of Glomus versiforme]RHZ35673.1 hypothetical protein GvMRE_IIg20 [endosymbiont GvMRE of Glomus versiforme]
MVKYSVEKLEKDFKDAGRSRKGKNKFKNDAGYWTGGACNWGGSHNLKEDCETLLNSLNEMESLREIKAELEKCTNNQEYEAKKTNYIRKCEKSINNLQTTSTTSMFGICIVWSLEAMDKHILSKIEVCKKDLAKLKDNLERETYRWVQEIQQLKLDQNKIEGGIKENQKKLANTNDLAEKALLSQLIEDDSKKLKANMEKQKEIDKKFRFDPDKYVSDFIERMKRNVRKKNSSSNPSGTNRKDENDNSDSDDESSNDEENNPDNWGNKKDPEKDEQPNFLQENKNLIIIATVTCLALFYFYSQKPEETNNYDYY